MLTSHDGRQVHLTAGNRRAIARLISHHIAVRAHAQPSDTSVTLICDPGDREAVAAAHQLGGSFLSRPTAMLRVGRLRPILQAWVTGIRLHLARGSARASWTLEPRDACASQPTIPAYKLLTPPTSPRPARAYPERSCVG